MRVLPLDHGCRGNHTGSWVHRSARLRSGVGEIIHLEPSGPGAPAMPPCLARAGLIPGLMRGALHGLSGRSISELGSEHGRKYSDTDRLLPDPAFARSGIRHRVPIATRCQNPPGGTCHRVPKSRNSCCLLGEISTISCCLLGHKPEFRCCLLQEFGEFLEIRMMF